MTAAIPFCEPVVYRYADAVHQILDRDLSLGVPKCAWAMKQKYGL